MQPEAQNARLDVVDAVRGFALCGILLVNIVNMGWLMDSDEPARGVRDGGLSTALWWVEKLLVHGNMRGLFSLLFGASMLLFLAKAERSSATRADANRLMLRRLFWLFMFGILDQTLLLWTGDILSIYGIAGLIALPFATAAPRKLIASAAIVLAGVSLFMVYQQLPKREIIANGPALEASSLAGQHLAAADEKQLERWREWRTGRQATVEQITTERRARLGGYGDNLRYFAKMSWEWSIDWNADVRWVFDAVGFMLVGMLLFRLGWLQGEAPTRTYALMAIVGYGLGLPLKAIEAYRDWHLMAGIAAPSFAMFWLPAATMQAARLLVTLGHAGLFLWCWKSFGWRLAGLQALGRMAFTGYLMQSVLGAVIFSGFGLALWGSLTLAGLWLAAAVIWAIEIAFAVAWLSRFSMGPFEWVWRALTYGRAPRLAIRPSRASPSRSSGGGDSACA